MPEPVNSGNPSGQPRKELSMEMRLLLAFLLMGAVMFVTPYFFKSAAPTPPVKTTSESGAPTGAISAPTGAVTAPTGAPETAPPPAEATASVAPAAPATAEQVHANITIDTDV